MPDSNSVSPRRRCRLVQHTGIGAVLSILPLQPGLVQLIWALSSWPAEPWAMQSLPLLLLCRWIAPGVEVGDETLPSSLTVPGNRWHKAVGLPNCLDLCWRTDLTGSGLLSLLQLLALREHQGCDLLLYLPPAVIISLLSLLQHGTYCTLWDSLHDFS